MKKFKRLLALAMAVVLSVPTIITTGMGTVPVKAAGDTVELTVSSESAKYALVVLTERKTRHEKIFKVKDHTAESVVKCINSLERKWGKLFPKIFKTITVDNGTEFSDCKGIEKTDDNGKNGRTKVYYCHPYCSAERGSNENQNRMIRRHIPKGTNFDKKSKKEIQKIEDWINNYPRPMFGGKSSQDLYNEEIKKII